MKKYRIRWTQVRYGESFVLANSEMEAKEKAGKNQDYGWHELEPELPLWHIDDVEEDEDNECDDCGTCDSELVEVFDQNGERKGVCIECAKEYKQKAR